MWLDSTHMFTVLFEISMEFNEIILISFGTILASVVGIRLLKCYSSLCSSRFLCCYFQSTNLKEIYIHIILLFLRAPKFHIDTNVKEILTCNLAVFINYRMNNESPSAFYPLNFCSLEQVHSSFCTQVLNIFLSVYYLIPQSVYQFY